MKIAQIVASIEARHGGPSRSVRGLASGLSKAGHVVELLSTSDQETGDLVDGTLTTRLFQRGRPSSLCPAARLRQHLLATDIDLVHHHGLWLRTLHYARQAAAAKSIPLVLSPRGMMSPWAWKHRRWKKRIASFLIHPGAFDQVDGWHATCQEEADDVRRLGFTQPVCVAPNGVVPPSASERTAEELHWRTRLPALANRRVALFYSRLHSKKRVIELIDLWLAAPRGDWVLLIVGIPEEYSVNQIDAYILRNGGAGRVVVQDGNAQPPPYAIASLFLLPSHSENFGLVVAESLVRGVPALVTDGTPWHELNTQGAGRCVAWIDYGHALDSFLAHTPGELECAGSRGRTWASEAFDWANVARSLVDFYASLRHAR